MHNYSIVWHFEGVEGIELFLLKYGRLASIIESNRYEWLVWLDYDTLITNATISIESAHISTKSIRVYTALLVSLRDLTPGTVKTVREL